MRLVKFFSDGKTRWGALGANRIDEILNPLRMEKQAENSITMS